MFIKTRTVDAQRHPWISSHNGRRKQEYCPFQGVSKYDPRTGPLTEAKSLSDFSIGKVQVSDVTAM